MNKKRGFGTLLTAFLFSLPGPLITLYAVFTGYSATQLADFLRRTAEIVASLVSLILFRKLAWQTDDEARAKLERMGNQTVAGAMLLSGIALFAVGILRLFQKGMEKTSLLGLVTALLGLAANTIFSLRYRKLARTEGSSILAAQANLYRAKTWVDACVSIGLGAAFLWPGERFVAYIDALSTMITSFLILS